MVRHPPQNMPNTPMLSASTKRKLADATLWGITLLWAGYPIGMGIWKIVAGSFTGMLILQTLGLTVVCAMASSKVTGIRDRLKMEEKKQLPPHRYDEDVLFWESDDRVKVLENEDGSSKTYTLHGFTDDNTIIVERRHGSDELKEFYLPELESYKNKDAQERKEEAEREQLLAKVENSFYDEKIDQLREIREERREVMREIENDPELREFEKELDGRSGDSDADRLPHTGKKVR